MSYDHWKTTEPEPPFERVQCPFCDDWVPEALGCAGCDWRPDEEMDERYYDAPDQYERAHQINCWQRDLKR